MSFQFTKAVKAQRKLRMALMGPSGSGKTYTALTLAQELAQGGKIALLDTERGSASLYSDLVSFDTCALDSYRPESYIEAIKAASEAGHSVLIIDSLSHAWNGEGGVLDRVNAQTGNKFADGWGKVGTPLQNQLMKAVLEAPMHVIATMRVKTEYVVEINEKGKSAPWRVGLAAVQRDGVEYEFDIIGLMDLENRMVIEKTRMASLVGEVVVKPDAKLAKKIMAWLSDGVPAPEPSASSDRTTPVQAEIQEVLSLLNEAGDEIKWTGKTLQKYIAENFNSPKADEMTPAMYKGLLGRLKLRLDKLNAVAV